MNDRQKFAYEYPLTKNDPWSLRSGYHRVVALKGSFAHSSVVLRGGMDGERPCWFSLMIPCSEDFEPVALDTLNEEQRQAIMEYAHELLDGVGQNMTVCLGHSVHVFKEVTDAELEGLPESAKLPAGRAVTKIEKQRSEVRN